MSNDLVTNHPAFILTLVVSGLAGCGGGGGGGTPPPAAPQPPGPLTVNTVRVFPALSFNQPLDMIEHNGRWYVAERAGRISSFLPAGTTSQVVLDISDRVVRNAPEKGLLGFVFHPDSDANGAMYVSYTGQSQSFLSYFAFDNATSTMDPGSEQILLAVAQPDDNHNGGYLLFEPGTSNLYWGQGDGGGAGDPGEHGQNTDSLLGSLLRVDLTTPNAIAIPIDNPFADGVDGRPEIFAYGLRNPWRFDQDPVSGNLYLGDVGQNSFEEINLIVAGGNYGWNCFEGTMQFSGSPNCPGAGEVEEPVSTLDRNDARSITGGKVYRGTAIPRLVGKFVFGDFITGNIWALEQTGSTFTRELIAQTSLNIASFAVDSSGEIYVVSYGDGAIYQIVP